MKKVKKSYKRLKQNNFTLLYSDKPPRGFLFETYKKIIIFFLREDLSIKAKRTTKEIKLLSPMTECK